MDISVLKSLGRWCNTDRVYAAGRIPAEEVSRHLFGMVVPRCGEELASPEWISSFCRDAGIPECGAREAVPVGDLEVPAEAPPNVPPDEAFDGEDDFDPGEAFRGSQLCLQRYVNMASARLNDLLVATSPTLASFRPIQIEWRSPLRN
ncbi:MAG TPA: hypothetical protein PK867_12680, partial [Pirellulales bacterium]|nr:hypothetical protein [Pirellulales bacterium]